MDYDFSKSFFEQFLALLHSTPRQSLDQKNVSNCEYTNFIANAKNCYLAFAVHDVENCYFTSANNGHAKDCMDIFRTRQSELCYETVSCLKCYGLAWSAYCLECSNSKFLYDCRNCTNCVGCVGLKNKSYCIFNKQYSEKEYAKRVSELGLESAQGLTTVQDRFWKLVAVTPRKFSRILNSVDSTGDDINNSKNCKSCFFAQGAENCKYGLTLIDGAKDIYDVTGSGINAELNYESVSAIGQHTLFSSKTWSNSNLQYCDSCFDSHYLFACVGLRSKQYCILNKQYTKEEYEALVPRIIQHMNDMPYVDAKGRVYRYGEFFPPELSPFAYNETIAQEYFPLTKEEAQKQGYRWRDPDTKQYTVTKKSEDLPDHIKDVDDTILKETIGCASNSDALRGRSPDPVASGCTTAFRIIPEELSFYRRMNLPLPRLCPNCRHYERLKQRNPLKLWHRACMCNGKRYQNTAKHQHDGQCPNEFETSYAPERPEIVYCEACYNAEVA